MNRTDRAWLAVTCWLGAVLRYRGLFANRFHADEALFASWARLIAVWRDPLLATQPVDKPPLLFYLQALFYPLLGPEEWAARLPSFIASLLLIPLTAQLARRLTGDRTAAIIAAVIVALAPLTIQFSATAFSDPLLAFWLMAALYIVARRGNLGDTGRRDPLLTGVLFGLALATKYQALLFLPLVAGLAALAGWRRVDWLRGLAGLAAIMAALVIWAAARPAAGGLVSLQWANVGGLRLARSWELLPRLAQTAQLWRIALGWPLTGLSLLAVAGFLLVGRPRRRLILPDALLALFILGYLLLHWLWAMPVWDRYLLPILPLVAILIGRGLSLLRSAVVERPALGRAFTALLLLSTVAHLPVAAGARAGRYPVGGQPTADGGAARIARQLEDAPYGTVLYDHWYSWHWRYHLFDGRVYVSWFPHADALLADLRTFAGSGPARYVALPASAEARPVIRRLMESGYRLEPVGGGYGTETMILYRIVSEEQGG
jgi:4-amino-4-deoxy-L-arabinose transferase-like glycosyltransferase